MKIKAAIVSFVIAVACCVLARATDDFSFTIPNDNSAIPAYDNAGLLIPRMDEMSEDSRETGWSGRTSDSLYSSNSKPAYRSNVRAEKVSRRTTSASPSSESDNSRSWAVALIAFGGLAGAIGVVAVRRWRRVNRRRRDRAFVPAVLVASLRENRPWTVIPPVAAEQQMGKSRRAA